MENLVTFDNVFKGAKVWVSGHTGFKGSWLSLWLLRLGAEVYGYSQPAPSRESLFNRLNLEGDIDHQIGDVRNFNEVESSILRVKPDFVFHLAAQPLVRHSYEFPVETFDTNVTGTINVLEALRRYNDSCVAIFVTSDKCYENKEWIYGYREIDPLGGRDPYSVSKAVAELVINSWRSSFFGQNERIKIASVRAGNVIGGGDWSKDRIVPDSISSLILGKPISIRNPLATRPWQHVLDPLSGYLWLAAVLKRGAMCFPAVSYDSAFNFGPHIDSNKTVNRLIEEILKCWPSTASYIKSPEVAAPHEATNLHLVIEKASKLLDWKPVWRFEESVRETIEWYKLNHIEPTQTLPFTIEQIARYVQSAATSGLPWVRI